MVGLRSLGLAQRCYRLAMVARRSRWSMNTGLGGLGSSIPLPSGKGAARARCTLGVDAKGGGPEQRADAKAPPPAGASRGGMFEQQAPLRTAQPYLQKPRVRKLARDEDLAQPRQQTQQTAAGGKSSGKKRPGALNAVPVIPKGSELVNSAVKRASRVGPTKGIKNEAAKTRNMAAKQLDALTKEFTVPLGRWIDGFPKPGSLHPFEVALLELTLGDDRYEKTIRRVNDLRKRLLEVGKGYAARVGKAPTKFDVMQLRDEGFAEMETIYRKEIFHVDRLKEMATDLRMLPVVEPEVPTLVLVGAPNVGKSSLVRLLSSGQPEVQNYPFTTRGIKLGHFFVDGERHVVTDTPGLLHRAEEDRNAMERLTLASIEHLPTCIMFVMDLTGLCGTSYKDQLAIRHDLKARFADRPWLDVLSKGDLLAGSSALAPPANGVAAAGDAVGDGCDAAGIETQELVPLPLGSVVDVMDPKELEAAVAAALQAAPNATRVSIVTEEGVDELKRSVIALLEDVSSVQQKFEDQESKE